MQLPVLVKSPKVRVALLVVSVFICGLLIGRFLLTRTPTYTNVRESSSEYSFIKPLLYVKVPEEAAFPRYSNLKRAIEAEATEAKATGTVEEMSIYFRDLDTSQWTGVNYEREFSPGSMLKVVTMMATLRASQSNPNLLAERVRVPDSNNASVTEQSFYPPHNPIIPGEIYTVEELLEHTATESDNLANYALYRLVGDERVMDIYEDLEIPKPTQDDAIYSAQEYSRLFRTLYNGTYLSRDLSEKTLRLLSNTSFTHGIVAGVPEGTTVSHKFGVRTIVDENGTTHRELHDCGIVYYPEHPYFLCLMTHGDNFTELENALKDASAVVWKEVEKLHK